MKKTMTSTKQGGKQATKSKASSSVSLGDPYFKPGAPSGHQSLTTAGVIPPILLEGNKRAANSISVSRTQKTGVHYVPLSFHGSQTPSQHSQMPLKSQKSQMPSTSQRSQMPSTSKSQMPSKSQRSQMASKSQSQNPSTSQESPIGLKPQPKKDRSVIYWIICFVVVVVIIAVVIAVVVVSLIGTTSSASHDKDKRGGYDGKAHWFKNVCMASESRRTFFVTNDECIAGSPPTKDSCSTGGICIYYKFKVVNMGNKQVPDDETKEAPESPKLRDDSRLLCVMENGELGVCDGGRCNLTYTGAEFKDWKDDAAHWKKPDWVNNADCEVPNPCWTDQTMITDYGKTGMATREQCSSIDSFCQANPEAHVALWVQHRRCNHGKYGVTDNPCPELPIKIWMCGKCTNPQPPSDSTCTPVDGKCQYRCSSGTVPMKNGVKCKTTGDWFCLHGKCTTDSDPEVHTNRDDLNKELEKCGKKP